MKYSSIRLPLDEDEEDATDSQSEYSPTRIHLPIRRRMFDPKGTHTLRKDVSNRKNTIVQRVIGYNYDDHSTAGGLYIRVGIGSNKTHRLNEFNEFLFDLVFCLGTVIHCGLSILSNLENLSCVRWTDLMDDFSRLLFSFIQFFFIFKHSNVNIFVFSNFIEHFLFSSLFTHMKVLLD